MVMAIFERVAGFYGRLLRRAAARRCRRVGDLPVGHDGRRADGGCGRRGAVGDEPPVFLFQLMSPMSDVPVTAWWALCLVLLP